MLEHIEAMLDALYDDPTTEEIHKFSELCVKQIDIDPPTRDAANWIKYLSAKEKENTDKEIVKNILAEIDKIKPGCIRDYIMKIQNIPKEKE